MPRTREVSLSRQFLDEEKGTDGRTNQHKRSSPHIFYLKGVVEMLGSIFKLAKVLFPVGWLVLGVTLVAMPLIWHESSKHLALASDRSTADQMGPTADQRKMSASDRALTQQIRKAIHHDGSLSNFGKNIKIFTQNGKVALRGPVRSEQERYNLGTKAADAAGQGNVSNQLDVTPLK
jgi:hypothetical protein